ncbi:Hypothetical protein NocV09_00700390, partial [Nannochloropsis oceanica]
MWHTPSGSKYETNEQVATASYKESNEKPGTYIQNCPVPRGDLFPLSQDPRTWPSCDDAYEVSWRLDPGKHLQGLSANLLTKLSRSMGFCPHRRCQLSSLPNSPSPGVCPPGLCYTKLEDGAPTYGACCFEEDGEGETEKG